MSRNPAAKFVNKYSRKLHRWGAIAIAVPVLVVIGSGIFLQLKKESHWIQPPTSKGTSPHELTISFDRILEAARSVPESEIQTWDDVDRLDVRPDKGIVKVRPKQSLWEVQVDTHTGEITQIAYRRSDVIETIHDGSCFHDKVKLWIFLPNGVVLFCLWLTGVYLWVLPFWARRLGRKKREARAA